MRTRLRVLGATAVATGVAVAVPLVTSSEAHADRFTGGDVVVYRVGDGSTLQDNTAAPVFLDEYTPAGVKLQSIALPVTASQGNHRLTATVGSRSEGLLSRSADGHYLVATGYDAAVGATGPADSADTAQDNPSGHYSLTSSTPSSVPRVVGLVDSNGTVDTTTEFKGSGAPLIIRSATSTDGDRLWATGGNGGILTTTRGSTTDTTAAGAAGSNLNALTVQGGQLFTSGIVDHRLATVGTGTPTSGSLTDLTGLPTHLLTYGYAFADLTDAGFDGTSLDTLYIADGSSRGGTIDKYRWTGSAWTLAGDTDVPGAFGVVANATGNTVSLAVTTPTQVITFDDTDGGSASTFPTSSQQVLATAPADTEYRGIALAPTASPGPSVYLRSPLTGGTVQLGGTARVTAYVASPSGIADVQVKLGNGSSVSATKSGNLWTAKVPTAGLKAGTSTVTVQATDQAATPATTTVTRAVALSGAAAPAGSLTAGVYPATAKQVKVKGTWTTYRTSHSPDHKGRTSTKKGSTATATVWGHDLTLTFDRSAKAGKVKVTVDGRSTTLDLFSAAGKPLSKTWTFAGGLKAHQVVITVLGTKNRHSSGTAVLFAALKVKA